MKLKTDKGVAGLTILLSLVVMLFVIGLIVMIFTLMGTSLSKATYDSITTSFVNQTTSKVMNNTISLANASAITGVTSTLRDCAVTITHASGSVNEKILISPTNYSTTGCKIYVVGTVNASWMNATWNVTGTYTYNRDNTATDTINETTSAIAGVSDWFPIFVVIGAMVVLILLTVIIITTIRGSGMVGGTTSGGKSIGTA